MAAVRRSKLFTRTLVILLAVFAVMANGASLLSGWELYEGLVAEYRSKGRAIARSIADSAVDLVLASDLETLQATVDQFAEIGGVSYVLVQTADGTPVAHTFVPEVPVEVLELEPRGQRSRVTDLDIEGYGDIINVTVPVLGGLAGNVHVGMDFDRIERKIWAGVLRMQLFGVLILGATVAVAVVLVRRISRPLGDLTEHANALAEAGLDEPPRPLDPATLASTDEIGDLARAFVRMEGELRDSAARLQDAAATQERIESELRIAREIQTGILPKIESAIGGRVPFEIDAAMKPAREVGGDFYDVIRAGPDHYFFAIGDVSGKGIPACLFMAVTMTLLRIGAAEARDPAEVLRRVNRELSRDNDACMFVTLFLGLIEARTGRIAWANGGHNPPYVIRSNGEVETLPADGVVLGWSEDTEFHSHELNLAGGDEFFLYTDGVTEAVDPAGRLFSDERLAHLLGRLGAESASELIGNVLKEVDGFAADEPAADDVTVMAVRFKGESAGEA